MPPPAARDDRRSDEPPRRIPIRQASKTISSIPTPSLASNSNPEDAANKKKSLLPQRSISTRLARPPPPPPPQQQQEASQSPVDRKQVSPDQPAGTQKPVTSQQPRPDPQDAKPNPASQVQSGKPVASSRAATTTRTNRGASITRPRSPLKLQPQKPDAKAVPAAAPASPTRKKTQMLPPSSRPTRSASLRQPTTPKVTTGAEGRGHARHKSQVLVSNTAALAGSAKPLEKPGSTTNKLQRPAFNTFQQRFSPKKVSREAVSTPSTDTSISRSDEGVLPASRPDIAALQTELLQLYLLYSLSVQQEADWRATAERQLRKKYNRVAGAYQGQLAEERIVQQQWNTKALHDWSMDCQTTGAALDFSTQIQHLSQVIQEVSDVTDANTGRYTLVVRAFEDWLAVVEDVKQSRQTGGPSQELQFVYPLDRAWKDEVEALTGKAELCLRRLQNLAIFAVDDDNGGGGNDVRQHDENTRRSALSRLVRGHRDFLSMMIDELKAMRDIELEVVALENSWVSRAADQLRLAEDGQPHTSSTTPRQGLWTTI